MQPLPLTNLNVAYYYVRYGSVLAYLSTPDNGYCSHSLELMTQLRLTYPDDPRADAERGRQRSHLPLADGHPLVGRLFSDRPALTYPLKI